ncbi:hypothetical protein JW992_13635 [candidate division KSB1 bacterium]|nr:hypothetical protein [candidate division KSB1 bacterium]
MTHTHWIHHRTVFCIALCMIAGSSLFTPVSGHYYNLSECPEEIKDNIIAQLVPGVIVLDYRSEYLGQIVPHIKKLIDRNEDSLLSDSELADFIGQYQLRLNRALEQTPVTLKSSPVYFSAVHIDFPSIQQDSLLAPSLQVHMRFHAEIDHTTPGAYELLIPPKLFFVNGSLLITLAREMAEFTSEQEKAIGRILQFKMHTTDPFRFVSAFPGYVRGKDDLVTISGVFYDKTLLQMQEDRYPPMRIKFTVAE